MSTPAVVRLYGSLSKNTPLSAGSPLEANLESPLPLLNVIENLGISPDLVQLVMVNHKPVSQQALVNPGDRIALFPREYPFFADWKDHRFR